MNIKHLCLIAGLLSLPVVYANAADITINVPVEMVNVPAANRNIDIECHVGVGPAPTAPGGTYNARLALVGQGFYTLEVPSGGQVNQTVRVPITAMPGRTLDEATHYKCMMAGIAGQPVLAGQNEVAGAITR